MDPVQHFDIPYRNRERAKKFYFQAFGWQIVDLPGSTYSLASSVATEANGMPKRAGAINGGLAPRGKDLTAPSLYVRVGDLKTHLERVRHAGGTVLGEPVSMGPVLMVRFRDTEGNVMTVFEQVGEPERAGKPGKAKASKPAPRKAAKSSAPKAAKAAKPTKAKPKRKARKAREPKAVWSR